MSNDNKPHISSYTQHAKVLIMLLFLTLITVMATEIHFGTFSVAVALLIAAIKGATVVSYFMHLKYDQLVFKIMVLGVFLLFALVILITFIDYAFR